MDFKRPADKCGLFSSPANRKKLKPSLTTSKISSPEIRTMNGLFDDNFSQFFQSQFTQEIMKGLENKKNASTNQLNSSQIGGQAKLGNYNFTQSVTLSQTLNASRLEESISPGQAVNPNVQTDLKSKPDVNCNQQLMSQVLIASEFMEPELDHPEEETVVDQQQIVQSSQMFLNEVTALHLNITSMIDETLLANRSNTSDDLDPHPDVDQFKLYTSIKTQSEYLQLKRFDETSVNGSIVVEEPAITANNTEEALEDQYLAEMDYSNALLDDSEKMNECIDPESSALASLLNDDGDDLFNEIFTGEVRRSEESSASKKSENQENEQSRSNVPNVPNVSDVPSVSNYHRAKQEQVAVNNNRPVTAAKFAKLGSFFDLPMKVKTLIKEFKQIDDLYDWQKECLQLPAIQDRQNLIYALPTSGGKTLVSEILILREVLLRRKNCLFILPYVSIVQEKIWALSPFALHLDFLVEEYAAGKGSLPPRKRRNKHSVYIATIEKALALFDSLLETDRANEIGLVVVDELHMLGESRGAVLESLLTKIQYVKAGIQIVGMSATIGNLKELAQFLNADIYHKDFRPVELYEYIKSGSDLIKIKKDASTLENAFEHDRTVAFGYNEFVQRADPDHIAGLVSEVIPNESCLIFCPSKKNCEGLASLLCRLLPQRYIKHKETERQNLIEAIKNDIGGSICPILGKTILCGIAYHHSGLTSDERRHLEDAFRLGILCVITCTSTLAAGVNLPAKRVIIRSPYVGKDFITLSKYKQMVGRAGRSGFGSHGESILICAACDNQKVTQLLCSPMDEVISQMQSNDSRALETLILSSIGLNVASTRTEIQKLVSSTLFNAQATRLEYDPKAVIDEIITRLIKSKSVTAIAEIKNVTQNVLDQSFRPEITLSQKTVVLKPYTKLEVSMMGKSSFKSGIDLKRAKIVHHELQVAQKSLVLLDYFHLLFIVTPFDDNNFSVLPDRQLFYTKYSELNENQVHTARVIGINESTAFKLMSGKGLKPDQERTIKKFFLTMVLNELWHLKPVTEIARSYEIDRGVVQNLMGMAAIEASCLLKYCDEMEEFWAFRELFKNLSQRLSNICSVELVPLMQLPSVKLGRAKQLYEAGYKKVEDIAKAKCSELVSQVEHMSNRVANQLISAAKVIILEKLENLREEVQECMDVYTCIT